MYHHILKGQGKIGNQGTQVVLDIDDLKINIFSHLTAREAYEKDSRIEARFFYKTMPLTFQENR